MDLRLLSFARVLPRKYSNHIIGQIAPHFGLDAGRRSPANDFEVLSSRSFNHCLGTRIVIARDDAVVVPGTLQRGASALLRTADLEP